VSSATANAFKSAIRSDRIGGIKQHIEGLKVMPRKKQLIEEEGLDSMQSMDDISSEDHMSSDEAIGHILLKLGTLMVREQNFLDDFFAIVKKSQEPKSADSEFAPLTPYEEEEKVDGSVEELRKWQEKLVILHDGFKDPRAEKRISYPKH
jgi:hypothetical protein